MKVTEAPVVVEEVFEAKVGFETRFTISNEGRDFPHKWKVTEVVPMKRISYSWRFGGYPGHGLVTFELTERSGATSLKLTNIVLEDFSDDVPEFERGSCLAGWQYFIGQSLRDYWDKG